MLPTSSRWGTRYTSHHRGKRCLHCFAACVPLAWRLSLGEGWEKALLWAGAVSAATVLTQRTGDVRMEDVERIKPDVTIKKIE